ncbi:MAG: hypothetical protein ACTSRP_00040 [Candidatus Helarchaeota archaeon]
MKIYNKDILNGTQNIKRDDLFRGLDICLDDDDLKCCHPKSIKFHYYKNKIEISKSPKKRFFFLMFAYGIFGILEFIKDINLILNGVNFIELFYILIDIFEFYGGLTVIQKICIKNEEEMNVKIICDE